MTARSKSPIIHAPRLGPPEFPNLVEIKTDEEYFFFLPGPAKDRILRFTTLPGNASASLGIAGTGPRIVRHRHADHIVKRSGLEPGGSDFVPRTGIRNYDQFRTVEHELSCRFGEFSVGANHGTHRKLIFGACEDSNIERFAGAAICIAADLLKIRVGLQHFLLAKITNKCLGVVENDLTAAVDD